MAIDKNKLMHFSAKILRALKSHALEQFTIHIL